MNISIANLPAKILNFISFLGFKGDNEFGHKLLMQSFNGDGVRSGMSSLILLIMYQLELSFAPHVFGNELIEKCDSLTKQCLSKYPKSALHLFMAARLERGRRQLNLSLEYFQKCHDAQNQWKELNYLCSYEMGMNHCFLLSWSKEILHYLTLRICK